MRQLQESPVCRICARGCVIPEAGQGKCGKYTREDGLLRETAPNRYLVATPISIETMPILHYAPCGKFLQITTTGCNFSCPGCVSTMLVRHISQNSSALQHKTAEEVVELAREQDCLGITFVMNDPLASYFTFYEVARVAKEAGLLVGCSSNGYFTSYSAKLLAPLLDFVNIGIKGFNSSDYQLCGAASIEPVLKTLSLFKEAGVHIEVSVTYKRGDDRSIKDFVNYLQNCHYHFPLQIMRYLPLEEADPRLEPSIKESEDLCAALQKSYDHVYLFNTPGTTLLSSRCPGCGALLIDREFFGPMGAKVRAVRLESDARCPQCDREISIQDIAIRKAFTEESFYGGYPFTRALEMIQAMLYATGVTESGAVVKVWEKALAENHLDSLHHDIQGIAPYIETIKKYSRFTGQEHGADSLVQFMSERVALIAERLQGCTERPRVYYSMSKPLFGLKGPRFENQLVAAAGGTSVNKEIKGEGRPGGTLTKKELNRLAPDVIVISSFLSNSTDAYLRECLALGIDCAAVQARRIYAYPYPNWDFGSPRWILGLMFLANVLHPQLFAFKIHEEAQQFYRRFYSTDFRPDAINLSFARPAMDWPVKTRRGIEPISDTDTI